MVKQNMSFLNSMKVIKSISKGSDYKGFIHCSCLRSLKGYDYGVIATNSGSIRFINLNNEEVIRVQKNISISYFDIIYASDSSIHLIIHTKSQGFWKLSVENKDGSIFDSKDRGKPQFSFQIIQKFSKPESSLYVQNSEKGSIIGYFDSFTSEYEVYDDQFSVYPLFNYQLGHDEIKYIYSTDKILFTVNRDELYFNKVSVISKHLSESKSKGSPVLQELFIENGETILGVFPFIRKNNHHHSNQRSNVNVQKYRYGHLSSNDEGYNSQDLNGQSSNEDIDIDLEQNDNQNNYIDDHFDNSLSDPLEGIYFWSDKALYEVKPHQSLEEIFYTLVEKGMEKKYGEHLVLTFDLDVYKLYEIAGDIYFNKGQYGRALDLYFLSNISKSKLVQKYIEVGRVDVIIPIMRVYLSKPEGLMNNERKSISNQLLYCYVYRILSRGTASIQDNELENFLRANDSYDTIMALDMFKYFGLFNYYFITAQSRNVIGKSLEMLIENRGITYLPPEQLRDISKGYFYEHFKMNKRFNALISFLPSTDVVDFMIRDQDVLLNNISYIIYSLDLFDDEYLFQLCDFFNPNSETMKMFNVLVNSSKQKGNSHDRNIILEAFILIILILRFRKRDYNLNQFNFKDIHSTSSISGHDKYIEESFLYELLKNHHHEINHQYIIQNALSLKDRLALSYLYNFLNLKLESLEEKILFLRSELTKKAYPVDIEVSLILQLFDDIDNSESNLSDRILANILCFWKERNLDTKLLESFLSDKPHFIELLFSIVKWNKNPEVPFFGLNFSNKFCLRIIKEGIESLAIKNKESKEDRISEIRLWSNIKENLGKDINNKRMIQFSQTSIQDIIMNSERSSNRESMDFIFTCGHYFSQDSFFEDVLPTFKSKVSKFKRPIPITLKFILTEYQQKFINMACPICTYNYLRERQKQETGSYPEKWV